MWYLGTHFLNLRHVGIEQIPALLKVAIERYGHLPETLFYEGNFSAAALAVTDYIFASGSLSYRNSDPGYIFRMIGKLYHNCRLGFAFNLLGKTENQGHIIRSYNPLEILDYCNQLTGNIQFFDGYWEDDYTVMMYH